MKITLYYTCIALCLSPFYSITANAAGGSVSGSTGSKNAIAKVTKVTPQIDNDWMIAVADPTSPTGYSVKIKQDLSGGFIGPYFRILLYTRKSPTAKLDQIFFGLISGFINPKKNVYPKDNYLPRQIFDLIFPGRYGNADMVESTKSIKSSGTVSLDPETNKEYITLPKSSSFELVAHVISMRQLKTNQTEYFFEVVFDVGGNMQVSGSAGGNTSGKKGAGGSAGGKKGK